MSRQRIVILGREITSLMNLNICLSTENKSKSPLKYSIHNQGIGERVDPFFHIIRKAQVGLFTTEYQRMKRYNDPMYLNLVHCGHKPNRRSLFVLIGKSKSERTRRVL